MRHVSAAAALVLLAATTADGAEKTLERRFTVSPGGALYVEADSASVEVSGSNSREVAVRLVARGSDEELSRLTFDATQEGSDVRVTMKRAEKKSWFWGSWNLDGKVVVTVPQGHKVDVRTSGGAVALRSTNGPAVLRSSGGGITATNVRGNLEARTSGGGISADDVRGDVDANTSGGDVRLTDIDGKIRARTSGGGIRVSLVGANRGISTMTSGGSIELTLPRATTGNIQATTSGGGVSTELPVTTTRMSDHHLSGSLNGGGEPIEARTSGGSISLRAAN